MIENNKKTPTIIIDDEHPEQEKIELLKEKLRYKQAVRENTKQIDHQQVRLDIQANALPSKIYFMMNALAALVAGYGLLANSTAVVIGAMLIAMMIGPITGAALAFIDNRAILLKTSLKTLILGVVMIYGIGVLLGLIHFNLPITQEILSRTQPTIIDLMIALAGGAAGAYASISPRLSVAVVGVAVATALVPPLVASGILTARLEFAKSGNAFLLALTNMVAIQISSSLVLWIAGFRRGSDLEIKSHFFEFVKRNLISLIFLISLAIYLSFNFSYMIKQQLYETKVKQEINTFFNTNHNFTDHIQFDKRKKLTTVRVVVRGEHVPTEQQINQINHILSTTNKRETKVQVLFIPTQIIQSNQ